MDLGGDSLIAPVTAGLWNTSQVGELQDSQTTHVSNVLHIMDAMNSVNPSGKSTVYSVISQIH